MSDLTTLLSGLSTFTYIPFSDEANLDGTLVASTFADEFNNVSAIPMADTSYPTYKMEASYLTDRLPSTCLQVAPNGIIDPLVQVGS